MNKHTWKNIYALILLIMTMFAFVLCIVSVIPSISNKWLDLTFFITLIITVLASIPMQIGNTKRSFKHRKGRIDRYKVICVITALICLSILIICVIDIVYLFI